MDEQHVLVSDRETSWDVSGRGGKPAPLRLWETVVDRFPWEKRRSETSAGPGYNVILTNWFPSALKRGSARLEGWHYGGIPKQPQRPMSKDKVRRILLISVTGNVYAKNLRTKRSFTNAACTLCRLSCGMGRGEGPEGPLVELKCWSSGLENCFLSVTFSLIITFFFFFIVSFCAFLYTQTQTQTYKQEVYAIMQCETAGPLMTHWRPRLTAKRPKSQN